MRHLSGKEMSVADIFSAEAVRLAKQSPCEKSKRGVVIVKDDVIVGRGFNGPPGGYACAGVCREYCSEYTVHAEMRAVFNALMSGVSLFGARAYHVKAVDGVAVPKGIPSCLPCSKHMLDVGLSEIVLMDEQGYALYGVEEFYLRTTENVALPIPREL
jgi:deoxycytidylate deaminase